MGYKIIYETKKNGHPFRFFIMTALFFALFLFVFPLIWPEVWGVLKALLIPRALEVMASSLDSGNDISQAVAAFCQELTHGQ